jgi:hypothetical protein
MKPLLISASAAFFSLSAVSACAEEAKKPESEVPAEKIATSKDSKPTQEELEAKFKATLTNATMSGRWSVVKDGKAEPDKEDKYTINGVTKLFGENWIIRARIQYGKRDITAPIPVKVKWAGDTPVITVDGFGLGSGSLYSARVLVYEKAYAGTWSAGDHGGLMSGVIIHEKE